MSVKKSLFNIAASMEDGNKHFFFFFKIKDQI